MTLFLSPGEREVEKPDPVEKQRHYDSESVRQFMAKQKAERQRRREEARKAEEQEQQKRRKLMQELISKQKSAVATTTTTTTATAKVALKLTVKAHFRCQGTGSFRRAGVEVPSCFVQSV